MQNRFHIFKEYNLESFDIHPHNCDSINTIKMNIFLHLLKLSYASCLSLWQLLRTSLPSPCSLSAGSHHLLSFAVICFLFLEVYVNGSFMPSFQLISLTWHNYFKTYPCCCMCRWFIPFLLMSSIPLCGYNKVCLFSPLLMSICIVSSFWLLAITLL